MLKNKNALLISLLIIILIILSFSLSGCMLLVSKDAETITKAPLVGGFVGGTQGLAMGVIDGAPPSVIQDAGATPFSFVVTLENKGEAEVGPGTDNPIAFVRLTGIRHKNFGLSEEQAIKKMSDKIASVKRNFDDTIVPGEITYVNFDGLSYLPNIYESMAFTFRAEACYDYQTYVTTQFCVKDDLVESNEDESLCMLKGPRPFGNSGAPLQVTEVEQAPINRETLQLNFKIEHVGNGVFFERKPITNYMNACLFTEKNPDIYKLEVMVEPVQKGEYELSCLRLDDKIDGGGVKGVIKMPKGAQLSISCFVKRKKGMSARVYQDLINVKLKYRYGDFLEVPILVQAHP